MGMSYSVRLSLYFKSHEDSLKAFDVLKEIVTENKSSVSDGYISQADFNLDYYKEKYGATPDNLEGLVRIAFGSSRDYTFDHGEGLGTPVTYDSSFDGTYSWGCVMEEVFKNLVNFLEPTSTMILEDDYGVSTFYIEDGMVSSRKGV